jgi:hypothetical protein
MEVGLVDVAALVYPLRWGNSPIAHLTGKRPYVNRNPWDFHGIGPAINRRTRDWAGSRGPDRAPLESEHMFD